MELHRRVYTAAITQKEKSA